MTTEKSLVLDSRQVLQKIKRMAYEIYERNFNEKEVVIAGIDGQGYTLAEMLARELTQIAPLAITVVRVSLDKLAPRQGEVILDVDLKTIRRKCVVLVDDVLNTGRTLAHSLKPFLDTEIRKIEVGVLVNRSHARFPVLPNYTGYELSTTLTDHVEVVLSKPQAVYLK
jgi:pyrimidine operon attenuation protein/uracil phosphoribosyltransferase